jgi:acetyltransferase
MSNYRLDKLFSPRSVALVGASLRPGALGHAVLANLRRANPSNPPWLVNPGHAEIEGLECRKSLLDLAASPDLVVIAVPPEGVIEVAKQACAIGAAAAIVITAGLGHGEGSLAEDLRCVARAGGLRIVGPSCIGVLSPRASLDASFLAKPARAGNLAVVSQSGAIVAALVEWADHNQVGFSGVVSLGDQIDVDFGDCLDHFALDDRTDAILLYIEAISDARKFLSAARAAARVKPVIVVKGGRHSEGARAALSHTGALAGSDAVYDAAFRRAGLPRVMDLEELFAAAETLAGGARMQGERVGILTNGGGIGVLAVDRLIDFGGRLAPISPKTVAALDACLPKTWSRANPVDIIGDADFARYAAALDIMLAGDDFDAVLVINCPTALAPSAEAAAAVAKTVQTARATRGGVALPAKPVFAVWLGARERSAAIFEAARIPHFDNERDAVRGLMHLVDFRRSQQALLATPPSLPEAFRPDVDAVRTIVASALAEGRVWLDPVEATQALEAYAIPVTPYRKAASAAEAQTVAAMLLAENSALAMKILSRDITHKSDVGGVRLDLRDVAAVGRAYDEMLATVAARCPGARLDGVTLQPMIVRPRGIELIAGLADDPTFGPVVLFGHGGVAVEAIGDRALALPPLDLGLARDLISRARVSRLLDGYRDVPAANLDAVASILVKLAHLSADIPEIRELDLNPLVADAAGAIAVDVRIALAKVAWPARSGFSNPRFAIRPYPTEWEDEIVLPTGERCLVRPIRPEDAGIYQNFLHRVTHDDLRKRFFASMGNITTALVSRMTQIDYARTMAFLALDPATDEIMGVVRLHSDGAYEVGEFAILVRSDLKGHGLGWALMQRCIDFAHVEGLQRIDGYVLRENSEMLKMCRELGFVASFEAGAADVVNVSLNLDAASQNNEGETSLTATAARA